MYMPAAQHGCELTCFPLCTHRPQLQSPPPTDVLLLVIALRRGPAPVFITQVASIRSKPCKFPPLDRSRPTGPMMLHRTMQVHARLDSANACLHLHPPKRDAAAFHGSIIHRQDLSSEASRILSPAAVPPVAVLATKGH
jgi:hypothetical protein